LGDNPTYESDPLTYNSSSKNGSPRDSALNMILPLLDDAFVPGKLAQE
jgi:hypothetical protein